MYVILHHQIEITMKKIILLTAILISSFSFAEISNSEKSILISLYNATNGSNWSTKWDLNQPVSKWFGVKVENDKVIELDLSNNNLKGALPTEIGGLNNVRVINFFKNELTGVIPASIGDMKSLQVLNLSFNQFSGSIPASIANASNLVSVELFMNALTGEIPSTINQLNKLELLSLYNNQLSGELPAELTSQWR